MLTHLMVGSNDLDKSRKFYDAALGALGHQSNPGVPVPMYHGGGDGPAFLVVKPGNGEPATHANGGTISFRAKSTAEVDAFHAAGLANGGTSEGEPGIRERSPGQMYGAYLRDPDGNKICAFAPNPNAAA